MEFIPNSPSPPSGTTCSLRSAINSIVLRKPVTVYSIPNFLLLGGAVSRVKLVSCEETPCSWRLFAWLHRYSAPAYPQPSSAANTSRLGQRMYTQDLALLTPK